MQCGLSSIIKIINTTFFIDQNFCYINPVIFIAKPRRCCLHIACYNGNVALVEILLRNKCVVDQCDGSKKTPLFLACEEGHKDVVKSLIADQRQPYFRVEV
jgi:ankyrin repeat protein